MFDSASGLVLPHPLPPRQSVKLMCEPLEKFIFTLDARGEGGQTISCHPLIGLLTINPFILDKSKVLITNWDPYILQAHHIFEVTGLSLST